VSWLVVTLRHLPWGGCHRDDNRGGRPFITAATACGRSRELIARWPARVGVAGLRKARPNRRGKEIQIGVIAASLSQGSTAPDQHNMGHGVGLSVDSP